MAYPDRKHSVWNGGSMVALFTGLETWISKEEYEEVSFPSIYFASSRYDKFKNNIIVDDDLYGPAILSIRRF